MISYKLYISTMASSVIVEVILILCIIPMAGSTRLVVTAPVNPVQVQRILSIHCRIWDIDANQKVTISRITGDNAEQVISVDKVLLIDESTRTNSRTFIAERQLSDGSTVFFLSIIDVSREDQGEYLCKVKSSNIETTLVRKSVRVDLTYFPEDSPSCWPKVPTVVEGKMVTFNCTSHKGNPTVDITWSRGGLEIDSESSGESSDMSIVYSFVRFTPKLSDNGAMFSCAVRSSSFPEKSLTCHVGPLTVEANPSAPKHPNNTPMDNVAPTEQQFDNTFDKPGEDTKKSTRPSAKCQEACSAFSSPVFYWVVATVVAGVVALVFLITGVVLYIRYCRIVALGKERRFACRQSAEDVYEKLEYRKNDKTLYMSLDKHGMKADQQGVYGQAGVGVHYNATPTHIRPQQFT